ncbi:MAG: hypothetical protein HY255_07940 [Betaproteobacteria bacterium]|nr:hypothetical protein [Betaproteobacteria bacterium]
MPEEAKLEIRRRSKFGCVVCRCAIYQYEHIEPEFSNAQTHDVDRICLLCGGCHDKVNRGLLSKQTVAAKYAETQTSQEIRRPFDEFDLSAQLITVKLGSATFHAPRCLFRINGTEILSIRPPKDGAAFPTLNGIFCDSNGKSIFEISENVWAGPLDLWDLTVTGNRLTIKAEGGRKALVLSVSPPNQVTVEYLDMFLDSCRVKCGADHLIVGRSAVGRHTYLELENLTCQHPDIAVDIEGTPANKPAFQGLQMNGGETILVGAGVRVGVGSAGSTIGRIRVWQHSVILY